MSRVWDTALQSCRDQNPVWVNGDACAANLLTKNGNLFAVIDFDCSATGDPACDLTIAWTFFSAASRKLFRSTLSLDNSCWERASGRALWKGLITFAEHLNTNTGKALAARQVINEILADNSSVN